MENTSCKSEGLDMEQLKVLDLFAGAGGLSNGFEQTGKFKVKVAVEINKNARRTYDYNHQNVTLHDDITKINFTEEEYKDIDVVIGGPPCQGFSNANRQQNTLISSNNQLVKEYIRAIQEIKPKAFVMENVRTLESEKHKFYLNERDITELENLEIEAKDEFIIIGRSLNYSIQLKSFLQNAYENKSEIKLSSYLISKELMSKLKLILRHSKKQSKKDLLEFINKESNKKYFARILIEWHAQHKCYWDEQYENDWLELGENLKKIVEYSESGILLENNKFHELIETQKIINKFSEIIQNQVILFGTEVNEYDIKVHLKSFNVFDYIKSSLRKLDNKTEYEFNENHIFNAAEFGVPQERRRLILMGVRKDCLETESVVSPKPLFNKKDNYNKIIDAIGDLEDLPPSTDVKDDKIEKINHSPITDSPLNLYLNNSEILHNHVMTDTRDVALKRFESLKAGQNFHDLDETLKTTYTDSSRTQNTIYKRLDYYKPSDTVVNVRKSMWIHPEKNRAISIREAARLQSFQDSYKFFGPKDSQYQQIGNAVPPLLARAIAEGLLESLGLLLGVKMRDVLIPKENENIFRSKIEELIYL
jgi:DNA (cytosine-5)-methyltransferase 1